MHTQADQHRRDNDAIAGKALSDTVAFNERQARAWGKLAVANIARGNYKTAIAQLEQAIIVTSYSQYTGENFNK